MLINWQIKRLKNQARLRRCVRIMPAHPTSETRAHNRPISVIMVSYMTGPALMESIRAVQRDPDIHELIVVDNGNAPADRPRLLEAASRTENVRILQGHGNIGFARGCNYGAAMANGDCLLFLNPDVVLEIGAARKMADVGDSTKAPWIAGGLLLTSTGREQRGARRGALTFGTALTSFTPLHRLPGLQSIYRENLPLPSDPVPMPTVSGANLMMDQASFYAVGGFDAAYFLHVEDIAICRAARRLGGSVTFVPDARAMHYGSTSDIPRWRVEYHKLRGLLRYFWTSEPGLGSKIATILVAPLMAGALFVRTIWLGICKVVRGR